MSRLSFLRTASGNGADHGFSLVELMVVFVIFGIIIAGATKGRELITNMQIKSTRTQVVMLERGTKAFLDKFGTLPGDLPDPVATIPDCTEPPCSNAGDCDDRIDANPNQGTTPLVESAGFWAHLVAAGYYHGTEPNGGPVDPAWPAGVKLSDVIGITNPSAPVGGGFHIGYSNGTTTNAGLAHLSSSTAVPDVGHYLALKAWPSKTTGGSPISQGPRFKPNLAMRIDSMLDDGDPGKGLVLAAEGSSEECADDNEYLIDNNVIACALYIRVYIEPVRDPFDTTGPVCRRRLR